MTYTKDNLRQIFQQSFNMNEWQQMLRHYFQATELRAELERIDGTTEDEQGYYLGAIDTTDSYRIGLFYYQIQHGNVARKRVGLRNLVKSFVNPNWGEFDAALVVFDSDSAKIVNRKFLNSKSLWRLSFVSDIKGESTAPKRYTFVFGEGDSFYNTPVGRFEALQRNGISFENIKDAFSVEALSKEFFDEYREHYADIVEYITGKRYVKEKGKWVEKTIHEPCHEIFNQFVAVYKDPEKTVRDYIKKLMGRLVFLQFLQKKEWMGVPADRQDWNGGDTRFLQNKFNEFIDKDNFIDGFLEPLFNDLNTNRQDNNDLASPKVGSDIKIPFLNGGLFQLDEEDCSSIRLPQHLLGDVLDFFERYNFTIDENDPNDAQIGVDPEMLGRVFENLLEDNKDKGAFYTPKEIVQYMCQESLIAYLQTGVEDETIKESIRQFVLTHEAEHLGSMAEDISIKLLNVKICDPAIGSGAFPMGLLRQLYLCQCAIHPDLEEKNAADIKRHIIQNNIYGVDIEKGAVDIARLRFWLSLIVDEETPRFLPNLDFKIMQGNSLLEQYKGADLSKMTELKAEKHGIFQTSMFDDMLDVLRLDLRTKLDEYYNCSDHQRKENLKQEIIENVKQQLHEQRINVDFGDLDLSANDQFTLWHTWFYDVFSQGGFDIVIGNPPYIRPHNLPEETKQLLWKYFDTYVKKADFYVCFMENALRIAKKRGIITFIVSDGWLRLDSFENIRQHVLNTADVLTIIDFTKDVFETATVKTCIFLFSKGITSNHQILSSVIEDKVNLSQLGFKSTPQTTFVCTYKNIFDLSVDSSSLQLKNKLQMESVKLGSSFSLAFGIKTGDDERFLTFNPTISPDCRKLVRGADISRWCIDFKGEYVIYQPEKMRDNKKTARPGNSERFEQPKVLVRDTGGGLIVTFDDDNYYVKDVIIIENNTKSRKLLKTLAALLNSKPLRWYYEASFPTLHVQRDELASLPIPNFIFDANAQSLIVPVVDKILASRKASVSSEITILGHQIDQIFYHLYGLTYDEILIVDPDTPITREEYK